VEGKRASNVQIFNPQESRRDSRKRILPHFGQFRIDRISRPDIQRFVAELDSSGCAPKSIHLYHGVLSTILTKAVEWDYIPHNPAHGVRLPRIVPVRAKWVLTIAQAQQLLDRLSLLPRTIVGLALLTGARRGELFALRWESFDATKHTLSIQEAVYDRVIDRPKTQGSIRIIPLSQPAVRMLNAWFKAATKKAPEDFIFSTNTANRKSRGRLYGITSCRHVATWVCRVPVGSPSAEPLRHGQMRTALAPSKRGELMGNSAEINANVYTQTTDEGLRRAVEDEQTNAVQQVDNDHPGQNDRNPHSARFNGNEPFLLPPRVGAMGILECYGIYVKDASAFLPKNFLDKVYDEDPRLRDLPAIFLCPERIDQINRSLTRLGEVPSHSSPSSDLFLRMTLLHELGHHFFPVHEYAGRFLSEGLANFFCYHAYSIAMTERGSCIKLGTCSHRNIRPIGH
jgi:integrase